jgi:predicted MFS family arabinose efflux permease
VFIAFEFTIVASIPLMTEMVPEARGRVMSTNVAFHAGGRMLGALLGGLVFPFGFIWNGVVALACNLVAVAVIIFFVRERR